MAHEAILTLDTPFDSVVHRPVARVVARVLSRTPLTANQLTVLTLAPAAAATFFFSRGTAAGSAWGILFFYLWAMLDHADGELARIKKTQSDFGRRLDDACDIVASNIMMIGLFAGLCARTDWPDGPLVALFAAGLLLEKLGGELLLRIKRRVRKDAVDEGKVDHNFVRWHKFLDGLSGREPFYLLILFTIAAEWAGGRWPYAVTALLIGGCWVMASFSFAVALGLSRRR